jgi:hypothetical protein
MVDEKLWTLSPRLTGVTPHVSLGRIPLGRSLTEGLMQVGSAQPLELGDGRIKIQRRSSQGGHRRTEERKQNRLHSLSSPSAVLSVPEFGKSIGLTSPIIAARG